MGRQASTVRAWQVTQSWGGNVQKSEVFSGTFEVTLGDEPGCDLPVAREGRHVFLRNDEAGTVLSIPRGARGIVAGRDEVVEADGEDHAEIQLGEEGRALLEIEGMEVLVHSTETPERIPAGRPLTWREHRFTAASFAVHAALLLGIFLVPPTAMSLVVDHSQTRRRLAEIATAPREEAIPDWVNQVASPTQGTNEGQPMEGEMGMAGDPNETATNRQLQRRGPADNPRPLVSRMTAEQVRTAGILGLLPGGPSDPTGSLYGEWNAEGRDPQTLVGNIHGDLFGPAFGMGGWGPAGTGRGGCPAGTPPEDCARGTVGLGRTGMIGSIGGCSAERLDELVRQVGRARAVEMCTGGHRGVGIGDPNGGRPPREHGPRILPREVTLSGGLSKEAIRRVVRSHMNEIRFCYEQGLRTRPDLSGRVSVGFTVRGDGAVLASRVATSTLGDARVEQCMAGAVGRWAFPSAENGGVTVVTYPFVVLPAEGE